LWKLRLQLVLEWHGTYHGDSGLGHGAGRYACRHQRLFERHASGRGHDHERRLGYYRGYRDHWDHWDYYHHL
jgi:hypothetical protein